MLGSHTVNNYNTDFVECMLDSQQLNYRNHNQNFFYVILKLIQFDSRWEQFTTDYTWILQEFFLRIQFLILRITTFSWFQHFKIQTDNLFSDLSQRSTICFHQNLNPSYFHFNTSRRNSLDFYFTATFMPFF